MGGKISQTLKPRWGRHIPSGAPTQHSPLRSDSHLLLVRQKDSRPSGGRRQVPLWLLSCRAEALLPTKLLEYFSRGCIVPHRRGSCKGNPAEGKHHRTLRDGGQQRGLAGQLLDTSLALWYLSFRDTRASCHERKQPTIPGPSGQRRRSSTDS